MSGGGKGGGLKRRGGGGATLKGGGADDLTQCVVIFRCNGFRGLSRFFFFLRVTSELVTSQ